MEIEFFCHPSEATKWYEFWRQTALRLVGEPRPRRQEPAPPRARAGRARALREGWRRRWRHRVRVPVHGREGLRRARGHRAPRRLRPPPAPEGRRREARVLRPGAERALPAARDRARRRASTRGLLAVLCEAYTGTRPAAPELMSFHPRLAPIKAGVFPLVNKDGMPEIAEKLYRDVRASASGRRSSTRSSRSASATRAWTRPARRSASRSTARRSPTRPSPCASATRARRSGSASIASSSGSRNVSAADGTSVYGSGGCEKSGFTSGDTDR